MKLIFERYEDGRLNIKIQDGLAEIPFSYVEMIKRLREKNEFEPPEYFGNITEEEKSVVRDMLDDLNSRVRAKTFEY